MNILFLLLKLIGILVLAVIALLLLLVLTVLIVPIRYSVNVEHGSNIYADCRVNWLLHFINARISYIDEKLHIRVRLSVFTLYDNLKPKKSKKPKAAKEKHSKAEKQRSQVVKVQTGDNQSIKDKAERAKQDNFSEDSNIKRKEITEKAVSAADAIRKFFVKIKAFFIGIRDKIMQLLTKAADIKSKLKLITDFLQDSANREGFSLTFSNIKSLLKHILPSKLKSTIRFGTGDPCTTGQALGAISILYSFYGDKISITPDFENKVFEGKHYARGRISLITILVIVYKFLRDERFKRLKRNFLLLKEAL